MISIESRNIITCLFLIKNNIRLDDLSQEWYTWIAQIGEKSDWGRINHH